MDSYSRIFNHYTLWSKLIVLNYHFKQHLFSVSHILLLSMPLTKEQFHGEVVVWYGSRQKEGFINHKNICQQIKNKATKLTKGFITIKLLN